MKKLFLVAIINFSLMAGIIDITPTSVWAVSSCNSTPTPSVPTTNQTFTIVFPNLWPADQQAASYISYVLNFDNIPSKQQIQISRLTARDGQATVSGGVPTSGTVPFTVVAVISQSRGDTTACKDSVVIQPSPSDVGGGTGTNLKGTGGSGIGTPAKCVQTDLGCIPTDPAGLANAIFRLVLGIAGALAVLLIIMGGFKVATSAGNPDNLEDGRAMITQAIIGLVFILLATSILAIIGIDILGLTNFFQRTSGGGIIVK